MTPSKLARFDPHLSKFCWKCREKLGTLYHTWWGCSKAKKYRNMICEAIAEVLGNDLVKIPELYILGLKMEDLKPADRTVV